MKKLVTSAYLHPIVGRAFGSKKVSNEILAENFPEWDAEKIHAKIGVKTRYHVDLREDTVTMSIVAANDFLKKTGIKRETIDYVIFVSSSPRYVTPSSSLLIHSELGLNNKCGAIDINQGCSGYVYGISVAKGLIASNQAKSVLLLTAETYSKYIDSMDKSNLSIFGDGASCSLITSTYSNKYWEINDLYFGSDGNGYDKIIVRNNSFEMNGKAVFDFTAQKVTQELNRFIDISVFRGSFVFHQANTFMLNYLRKKLGIHKDKFIIDMEEVGNTVSSSIPLAMRNVKDDSCILVGFGVGLSWAFVHLSRTTN